MTNIHWSSAVHSAVLSLTSRTVTRWNGSKWAETFVIQTFFYYNSIPVTYFKDLKTLIANALKLSTYKKYIKNAQNLKKKSF